MIHEALFSILSTFSGLTSLVDTRIYPATAPQETGKPYVVYQQISGDHVESHQGSSGLSMPRYQLDSYAETYNEAKAVGKQIRLAIHGYNSTSPVAGTIIHAILAESDRDGFDDKTSLYRFSSDYFIHHREAQP